MSASTQLIAGSTITANVRVKLITRYKQQLGKCAPKMKFPVYYYCITMIPENDPERAWVYQCKADCKVLNALNEGQHVHATAEFVKDEMNGKWKVRRVTRLRIL